MGLRGRRDERREEGREKGRVKEETEEEEQELSCRFLPFKIGVRPQMEFDHYDAYPLKEVHKDWLSLRKVNDALDA
ncbi:hypothetical protein ACLOJK_022844 [Asimina triloba]